jgi:hypothetical protein
MKNKIFLFLLAAAFFSSGLFAAQTEDFKLDGVMYEKENPQDSVAIVEGQFLRQGDLFQGRKVEEIGPDYVVFQAEAGGAPTRISLSDVTTKKSSKTPAAKTDKTVKAAGGAWKFDVMNIINLATETKARADLKSIFIACTVTANEENIGEDGEPVTSNLTLEGLVSRGMLPPSYKNAQNGPYIYTIKGSAGNFEVHADPANPESSLRHFMIDQDGIFHSERGQSATASSPTV